MTEASTETPLGGPGIHLASGLWLDEPDAPERIRSKLGRGEITSHEAERLERFARDGYLTFDLEADLGVLDALVASVDRLWRDKPADLAYAYDGPPYSFARACEERERRTRYRLHDIHSHCREALELYLNRQVFDLVERILDRPAVAIQSLYFEYGSQQVLHRDPVVVPTGAAGHLLAAWIAVEDISPDSGALVYVPGSHRLPYYEFAPGQYMLDSGSAGEEVIRRALAFDDEQCRSHGLSPRLFTARKGEVLLWHGSLRHGGGPVNDESLTRKSFVVHYSCRDTYPARSITIAEEGAGGQGPRCLETRRLLQHNGCSGFDNPMRGYRGPPPQTGHR